MVAAPLALTDCTIWVHSYDMTLDTNKVSVAVDVDELDVTTFGGGGYRSRIGGLKDVEASVEGFQTDGVGEVGEQLFPELGTADRVWTVSPTGVAGTTAYGFQAGKFNVSQLGDVGAVAPFSATAKGTNSQGVIRGQVAKAKGSVSATGQLGSILTMTGPSASQYVYGALHLFGTAGSSITVKIQSATVVGFGSPTDRITIGPLTATGGTWATRLAGSITDGFWRMSVSAITGTWSVAGFIGVGS